MKKDIGFHRFTLFSIFADFSIKQLPLFVEILPWGLVELHLSPRFLPSQLRVKNLAVDSVDKLKKKPLNLLSGWGCFVSFGFLNPG